jgi:ribosome biogenesis GTPase
MNLENLGADRSVIGAFAAHAVPGVELARVASTARDRYKLYTAGGEVEAEPSGALWYRTAAAVSMPVVGDWVAARRVGPEEAIVEAVLPRRSLFSRRAPGRREDQQPIAANVDVVFLVCGLDGDYNLRRLERYLASAVESGSRPIVVLNKADLCGDPESRKRDAERVAAGAPVVLCSALEARGTEALTGFLGLGITAALLGSSGAGKSTLANRWLGEDRFRTSAVRESDSRGRHTTTRRELVPLDGGGALIDTPGMRELQLWTGEESVGQAFPEIEELASECRFGDCTHVGEPGCAVATALESGALDGQRWNSYRKLLAEARRHQAASDPMSAIQQKRKCKQMQRALRQRDRLDR